MVEKKIKINIKLILNKDTGCSKRSFSNLLENGKENNVDENYIPHGKRNLSSLI